MPFSETAKIRPYIWNYINVGAGIDLGCEFDKVHPMCLGMDKRWTPVVDIIGDITDLAQFKDEMFDWVYCSHTIEDILDYESALKEWLRVLKTDGYLILYFPYRFYYPNIGQPGADPAHVHDLVPSDILSVLRKLCPTLWVVTSEIRGNKRTSEFDEYSGLIVVSKTRPVAPRFLIENNRQIGDTLSCTHLCKTLRSKFPIGEITLAADAAGVVDKSLCDFIGKDKYVKYDMIIHQDTRRTEYGDWLRRAVHFTQFTDRVCAELLPEISVDLPTDILAPVELYYDVQFKDFDIPIRDTKFVAICVDTFQPKRWEQSKWQQIINFLRSKNHDVVVIGSDTKDKLLDVQDFRGKTSFRQAVAILSKARLLVSVDTSFVHFAHILKVPSIVLMGPSYSKELLYSSSTPIYRNDAGCVCCWNWLDKETQFEWKDGSLDIPFQDRYFTSQELPLYVIRECQSYTTNSGQCMKTISVDQVKEAVSRLL